MLSTHSVPQVRFTPEARAAALEERSYDGDLAWVGALICLLSAAGVLAALFWLFS